MQNQFGDSVRTSTCAKDPKEVLALNVRGRVGKAQAQVKPTKFKCLACAEQKNAYRHAAYVPGYGTNELRVTLLDRERRGLEPGLGNVFRRKLDEVVKKVPADFVELSSGNKSLPNSSNRFCTLAAWPAGVLYLWSRSRAYWAYSFCAVDFPARHNPAQGCAVPDIARSAIHAIRVNQLQRRALTWPDVDVRTDVVAGRVGGS